MSVEVVPLEGALVDEAAVLLAARHARERAALPLLPAGPGEAAVAARALQHAIARPRARGVGALSSGRLVAFVVGDWAPDEVRGRAAWVRTAGHAHAAEDGSAAALADLYAELAAGWVQAGVFEHHVLAPAGDAAALDAWYGLEFGRQQVHGLRTLAAVPADVPAAGLEIRRAGPDDLARVLSLSLVIARHHAGSPVFAAFLPELAEDHEADYRELLAAPEWTVWLALDRGEPVGYALVAAASADDPDLLVPTQAAELKVAATVPAARGRGVGLALTARALRGAAEAGASAMLADWRSTNLLASRFWPARGFRPAVVRLHRAVDPRLAWARG